ncbi:hypothetical protein [Microbacterium sp.]|uniref:hypothetical protein n=1 Tax=Microbacterium sp. TaxID=51671 RepID=UPI0039E6C695
MKNAIVRFAALYVFDVAVLLLIDLLFGSVRIGLHVLWAAVILTLAALLLKPVLRAAFARRSGQRSGRAEKSIQYGLVYVTELIIWTFTVWFSGVRAWGLWGFVVPPFVLLVGWVIYDRIDDRLRAKAGDVYDAVSSSLRGGSTASAPESPAAATGRAELNDGLTPEQRRMFDELG